MSIYETFFAYQRFYSYLHQIICPIKVHSEQNERHRQQVVVLEADYEPFVVWSWLVNVNAGQKAKREQNYPEINP